MQQTLSKPSVPKSYRGGGNSVPEFKNGGKKSVFSGFGRVKRKFSAKRRRNFWLIFLVDDKMKLNSP